MNGDNRIRVLVFPCGTEIGLEIQRSLRAARHFSAFGVSSAEDHGAFAYANYRQIRANVYSPDFIPEINRCAESVGAKYVVPAHDDAIVALATAWEQGELRVRPATPPPETCRLCRSKRQTYARFRDILPVPRIHPLDSVEERDLPLFLKPDAGQGSRGTFFAKTLDALRFMAPQIPDCLALEYLPGEEFTVDCFTNRHGRLLLASARTRGRIRNGISVRSETVDAPELRKMADDINENLELRGAWFFQTKKDAAGRHVLLEIAPRIGGTSGLQRGRGVNLTLLTLFDHMEVDVAVHENAGSAAVDRALQSRFRLDVAYEDAYLDFDDTIVQDGATNLEAVQFIFHCLNRGVRVHLLTRHPGDIRETLGKFRLDGLFDSVVAVDGNRRKSEYIPPGSRAIFIDDSFSERLDVARRCGIPVFDPSSFDALLGKD